LPVVAVSIKDALLIALVLLGVTDSEWLKDVKSREVSGDDVLPTATKALVALAKAVSGSDDAVSGKDVSKAL